MVRQRVGWCWSSFGGSGEFVTDYYSYRPGRLVSYEDLAYLVGQFGDSKSGEYDNPALAPLHDALRPGIAGILEREQRLQVNDEDEEAEEDQDDVGRWNVDELAREAWNYIVDIAWRSLERKGDADYLGPFVKFIQNERLEDVSIFTLNHDTLLERTLRAAGLEFVDGFGEPANGLRFWEPERFEATAGRRLVKLHGSVDWYVVRPSGGEFHEDRIAQSSVYPERIPLPSGGFLEAVEGRPLLLVGTHNKVREYFKSTFFDAQVEFYRRLNRASVLLVVGYGGQDKGVE